MRKLLLLSALLLVAWPVSAQQIGAPQNVTAVDSGAACSVAAACATFVLPAGQNVNFSVSGTFTGTLTFEVTGDGSNWFSQQATKGSSAVAGTTTTSTGNYSVPHFLAARVRATAWTSGTATVVASIASAGVSAGSSGGGGGGGAVTAADGALVTEGTTTDAKATQTDGTSVTAISLLKEISFMEQTPASRAVTGTFWQETQPVSGTVNIGNGSNTVTDASTQSYLASSVASTESYLFAGNGGTGYQRLAGLASGITAGLFGLVTRPYTASDGTNTTPTMDAVARPGFQKVTDGTNTMADPCTFLAPTTVAISQATSTATVYITAASSKKNYICGMVLVAGAAEIVNIIEGTGANCGSAQAAVIGSTTAANGMSFAANGGFSNPIKVPGIGTNTNTCVLTSGANRVAGYLTYVQQ